MDALRTPDDRFADLPGWPYAPAYVDIDDGEGGTLRLHYVDAGPPDAAPVVLMHGEPTWGYLYRHMIPGLVTVGHRVIVPDLIGFGRSDKPTAKGDYSYPRHVDWIEQAVISLDLQRATLFAQDWGSLIGLAVVARQLDRFDRIVLANGGLPDPRNFERVLAANATSTDPEAFGRWQEFAAGADQLEVGPMMMRGLEAVEMRAADGTVVTPPISPADADAYDAPFPDATYQAGALVFPSLVSPTEGLEETMQTFSDTWEVLDTWEKPFLCMFGKADPVLGWFDQVFIDHVPGAAGQVHQTFPHGGHFIQEYEPDALVAGINDLIATT